MKLNHILIIGALGTVSALASPSELCTPTNSDATASSTLSCAALVADSGFVLTGITVTAQLSWQDSSIPPVATTSMSNTITPGAVTGVSTFIVTATGSGNGIGIGSNSSSASLANLASLAAFSVGVGAPTYTPAGDIPSNATVTVKITTTEAPIGGGGTTPEPTSMLLFGSGFLALGLVARARKSRS